MKKQFATYEQSLALKELGFDEKCLKYYRSNKEFCNWLNYEVVEYDNIKYITNSQTTIDWNYAHCTAPLKQQVFDWFRKNYKLDGTISSSSYMTEEAYCNITGGIIGKIEADSYGGLYDWDSDIYPTHEEAEFACINRLIEILKK